jgi:hypothetical protein
LGRVFSSEGEAGELRTQEVDAGPPGEDGEGDLRGKNSGHGQDAIEFASHLVTFIVSRVVVVRSTVYMITGLG